MTSVDDSQDVDSIHQQLYTSVSTFDTTDDISLAALHYSVPTLDLWEDAPKRVDWAPVIYQREHISRYQMSYEEAKETWILEEEKAQMMQHNRQDAQCEMQGLPEDEDSLTYRGLDALHEQRADKIRATINACVKAVLLSADKDPMSLAQVSAQHSSESIKNALGRAESDLQAAMEVYDTTEALYLNSMLDKRKPTKQYHNRSNSINHLEKYTTSQKTRIVM